MSAIVRFMSAMACALVLGMSPASADSNCSVSGTNAAAPAFSINDPAAALVPLYVDVLDIELKGGNQGSVFVLSVIPIHQYLQEVHCDRGHLLLRLEWDFAQMRVLIFYHK